MTHWKSGLMGVNRMDDLISRQAAIDAIGIEPFAFSEYESGLHDKWEDDVEALMKLPSAKPEQRWVPTSERLPERGEYVGNVAKYYLAQTEYGDMVVARYSHSGYWEQIYQLKPIGDEIVAWMPLPKRYVPDTNDGNMAESEETDASSN